MIRLTAVVRNSTNSRTRHTSGRLGQADVEDVVQFAPATSLELEADENGVLLMRFDATGGFAGDTWHQSIEEARKQAKFEFGVVDSDWKTKAE